MSSAYSLSQIVGGLVLGALSDRAMSRRSVLLISFLGSSLSYGTIGLSSSLDMLLVGRVVVGLVKQVNITDDTAGILFTGIPRRLLSHLLQSSRRLLLYS